MKAFTQLLLVGLAAIALSRPGLARPVLEASGRPFQALPNFLPAKLPPIWVSTKSN